MSTSLVMMDTGAHVRRTNNTSVGDVKPPALVSANGPINFAMKFLAANSQNHSTANISANNLHLHLNGFSSHLQHSHHQQPPSGVSNSTIAAAPVSASVAVKLEPRVPSPCTADLAVKSEQTLVPSPCVKDLSIYIAKTAATTGQQLLVDGTTNTMSATTLEAINGLGGNVTTALSLKQRRSAAAAELETGAYLPGQTILPGSASHSPSPPPLLPNGHHFSRLNGFAGAHKRDHDDAFGPSSTTANGTSTPVTINVSSSNNNSLASLPSSTNSPSPPPLLTNGHLASHQAMVNSMMANGGNIASPTSSSFSDFGSTGKEDMSPSNSVNGYVVDSLGGDPKKKKGPAPRQQEELCLVCGDRASGYHYNALTCEGCKGFFRRSITKNAVYQCKYGNGCEIDMYMRRKCQECRLKKCLSVGMRPECVVPEYQCAIKREAKRAIKDKDKPNSTTKENGSIGGMHSPHTPQMMHEEKPLTPQMPTPVWSSGPNGTTLGNGAAIVSANSSSSSSSCSAAELAIEASKRLSAEQEDVIKKLVYYQDEFESPSEEDIKKIAPFPLGENEDDSQKRFQHVTEMTILTVQLIVEFSKRVPFFDRLYREDQITLLKACSSEVMMLRCSRKYDIRTDSIVYANNQPYTRDNYSSASISYVADSLFNFCRRMCMLKVDNAEYALLTAIVIFSDRPALCEPRKVEEIQEHYIETLRCYVDSHRPPNKCHFAKLLGILTELRTLGNINSEMCVSLKVQNKKLPPFLAEIWDIQDS